eukprot:CAMPEP_0202975726 /NCGR_PEP_ID=MMETSP1396-20130829/71461_1 /ASSEMBLY_ACC=CAM_ASM_000872 /TAXON_ID= /ORGANISM="Pseudokeronopsis sp., Strain Brazil" /LENGTH=42 /DNA_ID= /DNA_START= /DNA_END= /DNA_ORIENTATION=
MSLATLPSHKLAPPKEIILKEKEPAKESKLLFSQMLKLEDLE